MTDDTLLEQYMADTNDDEGCINFIRSKDCTVAMINYDEYDGWTPLCLAARLNRFEVVRALLEKGADVNYVHSDSSYNALAYCLTDGAGRVEEEQMKTIDILLEYNPKLEYNSFDKDFSVFTLACYMNDVLAAKKLFNYSPTLNTQIPLYHEDENDERKKAIDYAMEYENEELIELIRSIDEKQSLENSINMKHNNKKQKL